MEVLIGITSKNRESLLSKTLQAASQQDFVSKRISVFDDASTDNTATLVTKFPQVDWHFSKEPKGYLFARNMFLQSTKAKYYCSFDDDSWFLRHSDLSVAINYLNQNDDIGALAFRILTPESTKEVLPPSNYREPFETNIFIGCGHILRIDAVKSVGYYTPNPGYYGGEEKDLCIRLMDAGYRIMFFPNVTVWHEKTSIARDQKKQHRSGVCNDLVFTYRRIPVILLVPVIIYKLFSHLKFSITYKKLNLVSACFKGFKDFVSFFMKGNLKRKPVSYNTYKKFNKFYKSNYGY